MPRLARDRSPRRLLVLFVAAALVPSAVLVWLGWQLVEQDRRLERQRVQDALQSTANHVSAAIERELRSLDRQLPTLLGSIPDSVPHSAVVVRLTQSGVQASAGAPLVYRPSIASSAHEPPAVLWAAAERLEFVEQDLPRAIRAYGELAGSPDSNTRAGALLRRARALKKDGQNDLALATYDTMAALTSATVNGDPADLMARWARLELLAQLGRHDRVKEEAAALGRDLDSGRWAIGRTAYLMYSRAVEEWSGDSTARGASPRAALAEAIVSTWDDWRSSPSSDRFASGRRLMRTGGLELLLIWRAENDSLLLFAATPQYLVRSWRHLWPGSDIAVTLVGDEGQAVLGRVVPRSASPVVIRPASDTGLPWTLRIAADSTPVEIAATTLARRRIMLAGLALLALLLPATGYLVARSVQKEMALARQQADFVAAVSHEFRSPLTSLTHLTSLLRREFQPTEERRRQYYDVLARETDRLRRFVETLLDFGRMQAGATHYRLAPLELGPFVTSVVEEFAADAAAHDHPVSVASSGEIRMVSADRDALGRAIWNLLENAAKYSPAGAPIAVRIDIEGDLAEVRVVDQGLGIPEEEQPHIFKQFFRGAEASRSAVKGTGVGLAVVKHIVEGHRGTIRLDSKPGAGSTFSILLPTADESVSRPSEKAS